MSTQERSSQSGKVPPENTQISPESLLALAQQDAQVAHSLYENFTDPHAVAQYGIEVATTYFRVGLNASPIIERIEQAANGLEEHHKDQALVGLARLYAGIGKNDLAVSTVNRTQTDIYRSYIPYVYLDIVKNSEDAEIVKSAAVKSAEHFIQGRRHHELGFLAEAMHQKGLDPKPLLEKAKEIIKADEGEESYWYTALAEVYANTGYFEEALVLIPHIIGDRPKDTMETRLRVIRNIAHAEIRQGFFDGALAVSEIADDPFTHIHIKASVARSMAEAGLGNAEQINATLKELTAYEDSIDLNAWHNYTPNSLRVAYIYTSLAAAQAAIGGDSQPLFQTSIERTTNSEKKTDSTVDSLVYIAKVKESIGIPARDTFELALEVADQIELSEYMGQGRIMAYEDLGKAAIDAGYYDFLEAIFERYDEFYGYEMDVDPDKITLLCHRAEARARTTA